MNSNLPKEYKGNFICGLWKKIKIFFFKKNRKQQFKDEEKVFEKSGSVENSTIRNDLKIDMSEELVKEKKQEFMKKIEENPELLENFSMERLLIILQYYLDKNREIRDSIGKLKSSYETKKST